MTIHEELEGALQRYAAACQALQLAQENMGRHLYEGANVTLGLIADCAEAHVLAADRASATGSEVLAVLRRMGAYVGSR